jgi:hypothetical protein
MNGLLSLISFVVPRKQATILSDPPEVNRNEQKSRERQNHAVQHIKAQ